MYFAAFCFPSFYADFTQGRTCCQLCAQADWPLEGSSLPMEPPKTGGSTLLLWDQSQVSEAHLVTP